MTVEYYCLSQKLHNSLLPKNHNFELVILHLIQSFHILLQFIGTMFSGPQKQGEILTKTGRFQLELKFTFPGCSTVAYTMPFSVLSSFSATLLSEFFFSVCLSFSLVLSVRSSAAFILPEGLIAISSISRPVSTSARLEALDWNRTVDGPLKRRKSWDG